MRADPVEIIDHSPIIIFNNILLHPRALRYLKPLTNFLISPNSLWSLSEVCLHYDRGQSRSERDQHTWKCDSWISRRVLLVVYAVSDWAHQMQASGTSRDETGEANLTVSADETNLEDWGNQGNVPGTHADDDARNAGLLLLLRRLRVHKRKVGEVSSKFLLEYLRVNFSFTFSPGQSKDDIGALKTMIAGAAGGCALWTSIFPADVIKSRVQIQGLSASMFTVGLDICRKEGFLSLYNGLTPTICRTIPATAVLFLVYEYSKKFMLEFL